MLQRNIQEMNWNQTRSTFRTGEPEDHKRAKNLVANALRETGLDVWKEYPLVDPMVPPYKHNYDIVAFGKVIIVEIDDPNLHSKPRKMRNDKIAQAHAEDCFDNLQFLRLNKDELNNTDKEGLAEYMQMELWDKLQ